MKLELDAPNTDSLSIAVVLSDGSFGNKSENRMYTPPPRGLVLPLQTYQRESVSVGSSFNQRVRESQSEFASPSYLISS